MVDNSSSGAGRVTPEQLEFGGLIVALRRNAGLERKQVVARASEAGTEISYSLIANIETGHRRASNRAVRALAPALGVEYLFLLRARDRIEQGVQLVPNSEVARYLSTGEGPAPPGLEPDSYDRAFFKRAMESGAGEMLLIQLMSQHGPEPDPAVGSWAFLPSFAKSLGMEEQSSRPSTPRLRIYGELRTRLDDLDEDDLARVNAFVLGLQAARNPPPEIG